MGTGFLDTNGLKKILQGLKTNIDSKLAGKLSGITSANADNISIDSTNPLSPTIDLSPKILKQINDLQGGGSGGASVFKVADFKVIQNPTTLTAADCGCMINIQGSATMTTKLPLASSVVIGSRIEILSNCAINTTISTQGTDKITLGNTNVGSLVMLPGDTAVFEMGRNSNWVLTGGSSQLAYAGAFGSSLTANGWQRLPSGLIIQKGQITCENSNSWYTFSFPTLFPNSGKSTVVVLTPILSSANWFYYAAHDIPSSSGVRVFSTQSYITLDIIAIGN